MMHTTAVVVAVAAVVGIVVVLWAMRWLDK